MSDDIITLKEQISNALVLRKSLTEPLPSTLTVTVLRSRLLSIASAIPDLGVWQRFQSCGLSIQNDSAAKQNINLAIQWSFVGDDKAGYNYLKETIENAIISGSYGYCVSSLISLVVVACEVNRPVEAFAAALDVLKFYEHYRMPDVLETLCSNLAFTLNRISAFDLASEISVYAVKEALERDNNSALAMGLCHLSDAYRMRNFRKEALQFASLAYETLKFAPQHLYASIYIGYASALYRVGQLDKALDICIKAYGEATAKNDHHNICCTLILKGCIHKMRGEISNALDAFHRTFDLARQMSLPYYQKSCLVSFGEIYLDLNDPEVALSYLRDAISIGKQKGYFSFDSVEMFFVAVCYSKMGKTEKAEKALKILIHIFQATQHFGLLALCLSEIGQIYCKRSDLDKALYYFLEVERVIEECIPSDMHHLMVSFWLKLASLYRSRQDRKAAEEVIKRIEKFFPKGLPSLFLPEYYLLRSWLDETNGFETFHRTLYKGLSELERLRNSLPKAISRQMEGIAGSEALFDILIELEANRLSSTDLYILCQQTRARRLIDLLSKCEIQPPSQIDPELIKREQFLLANLRERIADLIDPEKNYWEAINQVEHESLLTELSDLWEQMRIKAPAYIFMRRGTIPDFTQLIEVIKQYENYNH